MAMSGLPLYRRRQQREDVIGRTHVVAEQLAVRLLRCGGEIAIVFQILLAGRLLRRRKLLQGLRPRQAPVVGQITDETILAKKVQTN